MPEFASPFSGQANDRKLTDEELIRGAEEVEEEVGKSK
jgi:hypothetical protein